MSVKEAVSDGLRQRAHLPPTWHSRTDALPHEPDDRVRRRARQFVSARRKKAQREGAGDNGHVAMYAARKS